MNENSIHSLQRYFLELVNSFTEPYNCPPFTNNERNPSHHPKSGKFKNIVMGMQLMETSINQNIAQMVSVVDDVSLGDTVVLSYLVWERVYEKNELIEKICNDGNKSPNTEFMQKVLIENPWLRDVTIVYYESKKGNVAPISGMIHEDVIVLLSDIEHLLSSHDYREFMPTAEEIFVEIPECLMEEK